MAGVITKDVVIKRDAKTGKTYHYDKVSKKPTDHRGNPMSKAGAIKHQALGAAVDAAYKSGNRSKGDSLYKKYSATPKASAKKAASKDNKGPFGASKAGTARLRAEAKRGAERNKVIAGLKEHSKQYGGEGAARGAKGFKFAGGKNATGGGP